MSQDSRDTSDKPKVSRFEKLCLKLLVPVFGLSLSFTAMASLGFEVNYAEYWFGTMNTTIGTIGYLLRNNLNR